MHRATDRGTTMVNRSRMEGAALCMGRRVLTNVREAAVDVGSAGSARVCFRPPPGADLDCDMIEAGTRIMPARVLTTASSYSLPVHSTLDLFRNVCVALQASLNAACERPGNCCLVFLTSLFNHSKLDLLRNVCVALQAS